MSASLVRKSLELLEDDNKDRKRKKKCIDRPQNYCLTNVILKKGRKEKIQLLKSKKNLTVEEVKIQLKKESTKLEDNVAKLKKLHKSVELDPETISLLVERAVEDRPVSNKPKKEEKSEQSIFTEEDINDIVDEYFKE